MAEVRCKTVKRFYYKGKGYASLFHACRQIAKAELKDELFGPLGRWKRPSNDRDGMESTFCREKLAWLSDEEAKAKITELMIGRFPGKEWTGRRYWDEGGEYEYVEAFDPELRRQWLNARAREIAKSIEVNNG